MNSHNAMNRVLAAWKQRAQNKTRHVGARDVSTAIEIEREQFWERIDEISRWGFVPVLH
jgi:hypothetical protein